MAQRVPQFDIVDLSRDFIRTKGNKSKLILHHCCYDLCKFNFTSRAIPMWNSLYVVSSNTVDTSKHRIGLDRLTKM